MMTVTECLSVLDLMMCRKTQNKCGKRPTPAPKAGLLKKMCYDFLHNETQHEMYNDTLSRKAFPLGSESSGVRHKCFSTLNTHLKTKKPRM